MTQVILNTTASYVAHLGTVELAGTSFAANSTEMFAEVWIVSLPGCCDSALCLQVIYGLVAPLPPLTSQAIASGQPAGAGLWFQVSTSGSCYV